MTREDAINLQLQRPRSPARAGVVRDLRKDEPYLAYSDFEWGVQGCVCQRPATVTARYLVRMDEMIESA